MNVDRLPVERIQDVETVALRVGSAVAGAGLVPHMAAPDHRLVGVEPEDMESHSGETACYGLPDGGNAVPGLAPRPDRKF